MIAGGVVWLQNAEAKKIGLMKRYIMTTGLMCICVFCSLAQKQMMYGDTSRIGIPFLKIPCVVEFQGKYLDVLFYSSKAEWKRMEARLGNRHCRGARI